MREGEVGWHHANDLAYHVVHHQGAAEHVGRIAEAPAPLGFAQDHRLRPAAAILVSVEAAPEQHPRLQHRHQPAGDPAHGEVLGSLPARSHAHVGAPGPVDRQILDLGRVAPERGRQRRRQPDPAAVGHHQPQAHQALGLRERQLREQDAAQHRDHRAQRREAERERKHHGRGVCGREPKSSQHAWMRHRVVATGA